MKKKKLSAYKKKIKNSNTLTVKRELAEIKRKIRKRKKAQKQALRDMVQQEIRFENNIKQKQKSKNKKKVNRTSPNHLIAEAQKTANLGGLKDVEGVKPPVHMELSPSESSSSSPGGLGDIQGMTEPVHKIKENSIDRDNIGIEKYEDEKSGNEKMVDDFHLLHPKKRPGSGERREGGEARPPVDSNEFSENELEGVKGGLHGLEGVTSPVHKSKQ